MDKKVDWKDLFDLPEGMLTPRSVAYDTPEEIRKKTADQASLEVRTLMEEVYKHARNGDVESIIRALEGAEERVKFMLEIARRMKDVLDKRNKGG